MAMLTKVWLEEYMQVASVTAEHDKSTAHNYQKNPQWFGTGTQQPLLAAVTLEAEGWTEGRSSDCREALPQQMGDGAMRIEPKCGTSQIPAES